MATRSIDDIERFLVGPERKAFHVNEKLVVSCSGVFKKMLTNGMRESQEAVVELDELEPRVFTSFIKYTIYGNYEVPMARKSHESAAGAKDKEIAVVPEGDYDSISDHVSKQVTLLISNRKSAPYVQYMESLVHQGCTGKLYGKPSALPANEKPDLEANFDLMVANRQFGEICAHHVKVYIFADKYDVRELKQLCLHRLHCSLVRAKLSDAGYQLLFDAAAFAFENTLPGDKIRKLFVQTCVADFSLVRVMPGYKDLCCQAPEVVYEIMMELPKYWDTHRNALIDVASKFAAE
ncbi:uncharacterized protein ColSpa_05513 [Colletotrichum spaethianum]|uniref:BTB domain-containing protein n=1 Tax=Colletotrichum spaethianum TaxID=700344 RepID=A0AA37LBB5_9PEZI|nr:uncharacterized protein ColSpa_05513 [Colletotrichum spaethianum]GKT45332.1 hypothetical protein ColSpa_05513 [Colletotrichum spaethianum]